VKKLGKNGKTSEKGRALVWSLDEHSSSEGGIGFLLTKGTKGLGPTMQVLGFFVWVCLEGY
jgi:hypothetical protein